MEKFQQNNHGIWDFTENGLQELGKYKTIYTDDTKPIHGNQREWGSWDIAALWIGIMVSIPVYMLASGLIASGMNWWK